MKNLIISFCAVFSIAIAQAQVKTPQPSPFSKMEQKVGLTDVTIEYSRPGVKGRTIFGDLVPYGKLWRTGANKNTMISFSTDVMIDGKELKKGTYAIFTTPNADAWEVVFYTDTKNWGTPEEWSDAKVALKTTVKAEQMPMSIETFTITIDDLKPDSALISLLWDKTYVSIPFKVDTETAVLANINKVMGGPSANDYYASATYYMEADKDITKAKEWIDKAVEMTSEKPRFWFLRKQALIYEKAGDKKGAIKAAQASLEHAEKAGNENYIKENKASLKKWGA